MDYFLILNTLPWVPSPCRRVVWHQVDHRHTSDDHTSASVTQQVRGSHCKYLLTNLSHQQHNRALPFAAPLQAPPSGLVVRRPW